MEKSRFKYFKDKYEKGSGGYIQRLTRTLSQKNLEGNSWSTFLYNPKAESSLTGAPISKLRDKDIELYLEELLASSSNPQKAYDYCKSIIGTRCKNLEPLILSHPVISSMYLIEFKDLLKEEDFDYVEEVISRNTQSWINYQCDFLNKRSIDLEKSLKPNNSGSIRYYSVLAREQIVDKIENYIFYKMSRSMSISYSNRSSRAYINSEDKRLIELYFNKVLLSRSEEKGLGVPKYKDSRSKIKKASLFYNRFVKFILNKLDSKPSSPDFVYMSVVHDLSFTYRQARKTKNVLIPSNFMLGIFRSLLYDRSKLIIKDETFNLIKDSFYKDKPTLVYIKYSLSLNSCRQNPLNLETLLNEVSEGLIYSVNNKEDFSILYKNDLLKSFYYEALDFFSSSEKGKLSQEAETSLLSKDLQVVRLAYMDYLRGSEIKDFSSYEKLCV